MSKPRRGSRLHVLDWTEKGSPELCKSVNAMLRGTGAKVTKDNFWMPQGKGKPAEGVLGSEKLCPKYISLEQRAELRKWWLKHPKGNVPNWDFLTTCKIGGKPGLVLVEAKAHFSELSSAGKKLRNDASTNSEENHNRIFGAIQEARRGLRSALNKQGVDSTGLGISGEKCYQLSNRMAWSWKLAKLGVPVVLVYLGFIGDQKIGSDYLVSSKCWEMAAKAHFCEVLPKSFVNKKIKVNEATMQLVVRSLPVKGVSPKK